MTIHHNFIELSPGGIAVCGCFCCHAERLRIVARIAKSTTPHEAAKAAEAFAITIEMAAVAKGKVNPVAEHEH